VHEVLRLVEAAALHRLNVLHLHLTDDQGWRLDVPAWPRLAEVGSVRSETVVERFAAGADIHELVPDGADGTPHGGYYTADDIREIVSYAAARHITVIPEIDLPGHMQAAVAAYPHLGNVDAWPVGQELPSVRTEWGISQHVLAPTDEALRFVREVLDVVVELFPSPWVHVGGDECPDEEWRASPYAQARTRELGLAEVSHLQGWFLQQVANHLRAAGRVPIAWDEVLDAGDPPAAMIVMAWQNQDRAALALAAGHDVVLCPQQVTYLDHYQGDGPEEPIARGGRSSIVDIAEWEPTGTPDRRNVGSPAGKDGAPARSAGRRMGRLLGVQGQLWTERMPTSGAVEYMAFPRLAAIAEVAWRGGPRVRGEDPEEMVARLGEHEARLAALGLEYRPIGGPRAWQAGGTGHRSRPPGHGGVPIR